MISGKYSYILMLLGAVHQATAHVEMKNPPPRKSQYNKNNEGAVDYSQNSPLGPQFPYPCRGFPQGKPSMDVKAGSNIPVELLGSATHNGGHCQFSVSYDDKNWVVLKSVYGNCLVGGHNYEVPIPADAPNGRVTFGWTWINRTGNREYYMSCADINITGGKDGGSFTGISPTVANLQGYSTFPEEFANDYKKSEMESTPKNTISPSGAQSGPSNQGQTTPPGQGQNNLSNGGSNSASASSVLTSQTTQVAPSAQPTANLGNGTPLPINPVNNVSPASGGECANHGEKSCSGNNLHTCLYGKILEQICSPDKPCKPFSGTFACI